MLLDTIDAVAAAATASGVALSGELAVTGYSLGADIAAQAALKVNQSTLQTQTGDDNGSAPGYQPSVFFHQRSRMPLAAQMVEKIKNGIIENNIKVYLLNTVLFIPGSKFHTRYVPRCVHGALQLQTSKAFKIAAKLNKNSKSNKKITHKLSFEFRNNNSM